MTIYPHSRISCFEQCPQKSIDKIVKFIWRNVNRWEGMLAPLRGNGIYSIKTTSTNPSSKKYKITNIYRLLNYLLIIFKIRLT